jgi:hypothetical protein
MTSSAFQIQQKIAETASHMLSGAVSYIEGARRVSTLRFDAGLESDPDVRTFVGVYSETDALPIDSEIRKLWSPVALEKLQPEIDAAEEWAKRILETRCKRLVERFQPE